MVRSVVPTPHLVRPEDQANEWVVPFVGVGTLRASLDGRTSSFTEERDANPALIRKITRGCARAFLSRLAGHVAFHAGAVVWNDCALLVLGDSGAGKSTTVAALCADGARMLADDYAILSADGERRSVEPTEDAHWLDARAKELSRAPGIMTPVFEGKGPVAGPIGPPAPLVAFVELEFMDDGAAVLERVVGLDAFRVLVAHILRFVTDAAEVQVWETERLIELRDIPCYTLRRPRGAEGLAESTRLLFELLGRTS